MAVGETGEREAEVGPRGGDNSELTWGGAGCWDPVKCSWFLGSCLWPLTPAFSPVPYPACAFCVAQASHFLAARASLVPLTLENDLPDPLRGPDRGSSVPGSPLPNVALCKREAASTHMYSLHTRYHAK